MSKPLRRGAEEARNQLPELLTAAQRGRQTIITRHGRPVALLTPISAGGEATAQRSLLPLAGTGRGLYGRDSRETLRRLRDEWNR
jgi:prevent-host-death family protein